MITAKIVAAIRDRMQVQPEYADDHLHALVLAALTPSETKVYALVQKHGELTVNQVVAELAMNANMARSILSMLHSCKLLDRHQKTDGKRPPVWVYKRKVE